ncbi:MAG: integrase arm-type DNA-binding domain-containing protein [Aliidongia sp.]
MASKPLTEQTVDRTKAPKPGEGRRELWDSILPGFGLRVSESGTKTFFIMYRIDGRQRRMTIGRYTIAFKLIDARAAAREALEKIQAGIDPAAEEASRPIAAALTVSQALAAYITRQVRPNRRDWQAVERAMNLDLLAKFGERPIASITRTDIFVMIDAIRDRDSPIMANRMLTMTKTFLKWCVERGHIRDNPAAAISRQVKEVSRDRVLDDAELARIWRAAGTQGYPFGPIVQLLMLTAQRRDEVAGMRWQELDAARAVWTLPAERSKNGQEHQTALSPAVLAIIQTIPHQGGGLLFTTTGKTVVSGWSRAKDRLDALLMAPGADTGPPAPIPHWTLHDLRRSAATGMARMNVAPHVVEKILNHQSGTIRGVAAIYNRHAYLDERRAALFLWAEAVAAMITTL